MNALREGATMKSRYTLSTVIALVGSLGFLVTPAQAELVVTDSGSTGPFALESTGPGGIGQTITLSMNTEFALLQTINGNTVGPFPASFPDTLALTITGLSTAGSTTIFQFAQSGTFSKFFDFGGDGDVAQLSIVITTGLASDVLPFNFVFGGTVSLVGNSNSFDFSNFANGGSQSFSLDATALEPGSSTFREIVLNGGTAMGSGSFAETATASSTPEPATVIMFAIGLTAMGGWGWRRRNGHGQATSASCAA